MPRQMRWFVVLGLFVGAVGCSRCGKPASAPTARGPITQHLPNTAYAVAVVPELGVLGEKWALLEKLKVSSFAAQLNGFRNAPELSGALMSQIGIDLRSRESLSQAGLDPSGGLAVVLLSPEQAYSVVAIDDEARLKSFLTTLSAMRLGAGVETKRSQEGVSLITFSAPNRAPALGYAVADGYAFVAVGASIAALPAAVRVGKAHSLHGEASLSQSLQRLPAQRDLFAYVPSASTMRWNALSAAGSALSAHLSAQALTLVVDRPRAQSDRTADWVKPLSAPQGFEALPAEAFLVARFGGDPKTLGPYWRQLVGPHLERAFKEGGFEFTSEVLDNLKPGLVASLSLSPEVRLDRGMPALDPRQTNPFRFVHLVAQAPIRDLAQAQATLDKLPALAPRFGARIEAQEVEAQPTYVTSYSQGEGVHLALAREHVLAASPMPRLIEARRRLLAEDPGAGPLNEPTLRAPFEKSALAVVVDLRRLAESVKALPSEAWGIGGFAIKASTVRWLEATDDLKAVTLSVQATQTSVQAEIALRLGAR